MNRPTRIVETAHQQQVSELKLRMLKKLIATVVSLIMAVALIACYMMNEELSVRFFVFGVPAMLIGSYTLLSIMMYYLTSKNLQHCIKLYISYQESLMPIGGKPNRD